MPVCMHPGQAHSCADQATSMLEMRNGHGSTVAANTRRVYTRQLGCCQHTTTTTVSTGHKLWLVAQVVYPGDDVSVPVNVTGSRIAVPAAVTYQLDPQTPVDAPFLPSVNGSLGGVLRWDPAKGGRISIVVPVKWSQARLLGFRIVGWLHPFCLPPAGVSGSSCLGEQRICAWLWTLLGGMLPAQAAVVVNSARA